MHSVDGGEVGLHSPLTAELQLFVCVICAAYFSAAPRDHTNHPHLPTCKAKANDLGLRLRNQDYLHVLYASQITPIIHCPRTQVQASKLKELHPFSYRTWGGVPG